MTTDQISAAIVAAEMRAAERPPEPWRLRWWFEDRSGRLVLGQAPNLAAGAATGLQIIGRAPFVPQKGRAVAGLLGQVATGLWGADELIRGVTPARRVIGAATLGVLAARAAGQRRRRT